MSMEQRYRVAIKATTTEIVARSLESAIEKAKQVAFLYTEITPICPRCEELITTGQVPRFDGTAFSGLIYHKACLTELKEGW